MTISKQASTRLPACPADSLCVVDGLTGSRKTTSAMLLEGRLLGESTVSPLLLAQAGTIAVPGAAGGFGGTALPRGAIRIPGVGIWTVAQVAQWLQGLAERSQIEEALTRFSLDRGNAADLLAAYAYVWARNILPMNARY